MIKNICVKFIPNLNKMQNISLRRGNNVKVFKGSVILKDNKQFYGIIINKNINYFITGNLDQEMKFILLRQKNIKAIIEGNALYSGDDYNGAFIMPLTGRTASKGICSLSFGKTFKDKEYEEKLLSKIRLWESTLSDPVNKMYQKVKTR